MDKTTLSPIKDISVFNLQKGIQKKTNSLGKVEWKDLSIKDTLVFEGLTFQKLKLSFNEIKASNFKVLITYKENILEEIIVSASRFEENKAEVPQQIETIKAQEIQFAIRVTLLIYCCKTPMFLFKKVKPVAEVPLLEVLKPIRYYW